MKQYEQRELVTSLDIPSSFVQELFFVCIFLYWRAHKQMHCKRIIFSMHRVCRCGTGSSGITALLPNHLLLNRVLQKQNCVYLYFSFIFVYLSITHYV